MSFSQIAISRPPAADTLGTGFMIRAIAQRPEPLARPVRPKAEWTTGETGVTTRLGKTLRFATTGEEASPDWAVF